MHIGLLLLALVLFGGCTTRHSAMKHTVIFGLNPALQRTISLSPPGLTPGAVNRGTSVNLGIGGKGQNAWVAATCMGHTALPSLAQWVGKGAEGDILLSLLGDKCASFDQSCTVRVDSRLRNAITLLGGAETTEVVEPSGEVSAAEVTSLMELLASRGRPTGMAFMGSVPKLEPSATDAASASASAYSIPFYPHLAAALTSPETILLIDATEALAHTVSAALAHKARLVIIKLNCREVLGLVGMAKGGSESGSSSGDQIGEGCRRLAQLIYSTHAGRTQVAEGSKQGADATAQTRVLVAATDGPFQAHLIELLPSSAADPARHWTYTLPPLPRPLVNPIGAGDAVSSGTLMAATGAVSGRSFAAAAGAHSSAPSNASGGDEGAAEVDVVAAFRWGLACGAASCMTGSNSVFDRADVEALFDEIRIQV